MRLRLWDYDGRVWHWRVNLQWEPRDCWVGVFWRWTSFLHIYVCVIPLLPFHLTIVSKRWEG